MVLMELAEVEVMVQMAQPCIPEETVLLEYIAQVPTIKAVAVEVVLELEPMEPMEVLLLQELVALLMEEMVEVE